MSPLVLTLDDSLASRLAAVAAKSRQALPEWAAEQLERAADGPATEPAIGSPAQEKMREALAALTGIWKNRGTTDELMHLTRGDD